MADPDLLKENLYSLQQKNLLCDLKLCIGDGHVVCHSVVLAACSPTLTEELCSAASEVSAIDTLAAAVADLFQNLKYGTAVQLLRYMYTGKIDLEKCDIEQLNECSKNLGLHTLSNYIHSNRILSRLETEDFVISAENDSEDRFQQLTAEYLNSGGNVDVNDCSENDVQCKVEDEMDDDDLHESEPEHEAEDNQDDAEAQLDKFFFKKETFHCDKCPRSFCYEASWAKHAKVCEGSLQCRVHGRYMCPVCERTLQLTEHIDICEPVGNSDDKEVGAEVKNQENQVKLETNVDDSQQMCSALDVSASSTNQDNTEDTGSDAQNVEGETTRVLRSSSSPNRPKKSKSLRLKKKGKKIYQCEKCDTKFNSEGKLELHHRKQVCLRQKVSQSGGKKLYECEVCHKEFSTVTYLKYHRKRQHEGQGEDCTICQKKFLPPYLKKHMKEVHAADGTCDFMCDECGKCYKSKAALQKHVLVAHRGKKLPRHLDPMPCHVCGKVFAGKSNLYQHVRYVHEKQPKKPQLPAKKHIRCSDCSMCFSQRLFLLKHRAKQHGETLPDSVYRYTCRYCEKRFINAKEYRYHVNAHEGVKNYSCEICGAAFVQHGALYRHRKIHTGNTLLCPADGCTYSTYEKYKLNNHMRARHDTTQAEQWYHCGVCDTECATMRVMRGHAKRSHGAALCRKNSALSLCDDKDYDRRIPYYIVTKDSRTLVHGY